MDISETIAASGLKICRCRLIQYLKVSIEGQGHFLTLFFQVCALFCAYTWPRYQVSIYGPLVLWFFNFSLNCCVYILNIFVYYLRASWKISVLLNVVTLMK